MAYVTFSSLKKTTILMTVLSPFPFSSNFLRVGNFSNQIAPQKYNDLDVSQTLPTPENTLSVDHRSSEKLLVVGW